MDVGSCGLHLCSVCHTQRTHGGGSVEHSCHAHAKAFEFQNLQGMGKSLRDCLVADGYRSRIYAPVGSHEDLLPYLVRRYWKTVLIVPLSIVLSMRIIVLMI